MKAMRSSISKACSFTWYRALKDYVKLFLSLASVEQKTICGSFNGSMRILEAYRDGLQYGCEELKNRVCGACRRIEDKPK